MARMDDFRALKFNISTYGWPGGVETKWNFFRAIYLLLGLSFATVLNVFKLSDFTFNTWTVLEKSI